MSHTIEPAKSGRASCRTCRSPIAKGELRLGVEVPNAFSEGELTYQWHHLLCGAKKQQGPLKEAMAAWAGEIPNRAELEAELAKAPAGKPGTFPYAERASTGRAKCKQCDEPLAKGELRVAVEVEVDTGSFVRKGPGYLHPACAVAYTGQDDLFAQVKKNSAGLDAEALAELEAAMQSDGAQDGDEGDDEGDDE